MVFLIAAANRVKGFHGDNNQLKEDMAKAAPQRLLAVKEMEDLGKVL